MTVTFENCANFVFLQSRLRYADDRYSGTIYVFRAKRADRVKLIWWDGTGVCLSAKWLEDGKFLKPLRC